MKFWSKAKHWRQRAEEVRRIREGVRDERARQTLEHIAREYDELAVMAEEFAAETRPAYREFG